MGLTTFRFFIFLFILLIVYFIVPKKRQWIVLLLGSLFFYSLTGVKNLAYIGFTSLSAYLSGLWMQSVQKKGKAYLKSHKEDLSKDERKEYKQRIQTKRKLIMALIMILNFGLLCYFKYLNFIIAQVNSLLSLGGHAGFNAVNLIVPLGISFYTFQTMGYVADVYWEKTEPQRNYFKLLLFTSFFPQITQGPISDYRQLSKELFAEHDFSYERFAWGVQRFMWGLMKKMILANMAALYVEDVFSHYNDYIGIAVLMGAFCYSIQIYADFSGYMDMMCGICEIMGIRLAENFDHPYFSKSVAEYWRRWHITLGDWFKTYIYYPIAVSKFSRNIGKKAQSKFGSRFGKDIPATIGLLVTWFATGLWHGANWGYIIWGIVNGMFIIATLWLEPFYNRCKKVCHINEDSRWWGYFQIARTFLIVTLIKVLPEVGGLRAGLGLWRRIFTEHSLPHSIHSILPFVNEWGQFFIFLCMTFILFMFSVIQRKTQIRVYFNRMPVIVRILILSVMFVTAFGFASCIGGMNGEFLYAQF